MEDDPNASYFGRKHAALVNRLMRYADYTVDDAIIVSWHLARQLANGNVVSVPICRSYGCLFVCQTKNETG